MEKVDHECHDETNLQDEDPGPAPEETTDRNLNPTKLPKVSSSVEGRVGKVEGQDERVSDMEAYCELKNQNSQVCFPLKY